ncbi:RelA/SpoT domain-containing protein [Aeromonas veronii]|uniref:RelA/SpoT domain-containing protein n=1 Tax=Aeromonas veronii TaxID=654 RepID=UPI0039819849
MNLRDKHAEILSLYNENIDSIEFLYKKVMAVFESRRLRGVVHSIRHRVKDIDHLLEKIERKNNEDDGKPEADRRGHITRDNFFERITDIAGVRVLHLHQSQFEVIHGIIMSLVNSGEFALFEAPKAYTWDPDSIGFFRGLGIDVHQKESYYTSIHYVLKPKEDSQITCEVQVRTLMEEVWGEIDHTMNYPSEHHDEQCKENIRVLARLVSAGGHLADSIMKRYGPRQ